MDLLIDREGYVAYSRNRRIPLGIVTDTPRRKAIATHYSHGLRDGLVAIEDRRYMIHNGIDFKSISRALVMNLRAGRIVQGGSTITQQLARNLMDDNSRTVHRKLAEMVKALSLELKYSKNEILDLYFNNIYWGRQVYGLRAASLYYFAKESYQLSHSEQLFLLTILRGPNYYISHPAQCMKRYGMLNEILLRRGIISRNIYLKNKTWTYNFECNRLWPVPKSVLPYITENVNVKKSSIQTSIDVDMQSIVSRAIARAYCPTSVIVICDGKIIGLDSSYGMDYPLTFRSNIGSTLKPFLYTFYRRCGISADELFDCKTVTEADVDWSIKEVHDPGRQYLTLPEALLVSNNNTFVNAAYKVGMPETLEFIAGLLCKNSSQVYPSSILGATADGVTLCELVRLYAGFFVGTADPIKCECLRVLHENATARLGLDVKNLFLKTGTTNDSRERFAVLGNDRLVFGIMRQEKSDDDGSKDGGLLAWAADLFKSIWSNKQKHYSWM